MVKNWLSYLLFLAALVIFYINYDGWVSRYLLLLALCLPVFCLVCSLPAMVGFRLSLSVPDSLLRGKTGQLVVQLEPQKRLFTPDCRFTLVVSDTMNRTATKEVLRLDRQDSLRRPCKPAHCGLYLYSIQKARVYDLLGLFWLPVKAPEVQQVLVAPRPRCPEPAPDLSRLRSRSYRAIPGGGFSETHELRDYRPGDALNTVHWKLSAKQDSLIVREAQEPVLQLVLITLDLCTDREELDRRLDALTWLCMCLLRLQVPHTVSWQAQSSLQAVSVTDGGALYDLLYTLLSQPLPAQPVSVAEQAFAQADWHYHVGQSGKEAEA